MKGKLLIAGIVVALASGHALAQRGATGPAEHADVPPVNHLPNPYETVRDWGVLPDDRSWGSVSGIHIDIDGIHVWAADRCGNNSCALSDVDPIVKLDPQGNVVQSFGGGLIVWPHGLTVDREGNVWVVDARGPNAQELQQNPDISGGHQVIKFSPQGEVLMVIGTPGEAGAPPTHLSEPNAVAISQDGHIFIAETHSAQFTDDADSATAVSRISKYAPDGTYLMSWGEWGYEDGQMRSPHALAFDSQDRLFVADRGNRRIQIFDTDGNHLDTWYQFSRISGMYIGPDDVLYAIDSESDDNYNPGWRKGLRIGSARTGDVWFFIPEHVSERSSGMGGYGSMGEGITADRNGNLYAGEVGPVQGLTRFIPRLVPENFPNH